MQRETLLFVALQLAVACHAFRLMGVSRALQPSSSSSCVALRSTAAAATRLLLSMNGDSDMARELVSVAKTFTSTNLGASSPSLLTDDFVCSGPDFVVGSKDTYVAGLTKETAVFQQAMPDFDLRPYGFMVDETRPDTVWFKIQPRGTLTGPFPYKGEVYAPSNKVVELPIQQLSVTIRGGKVARVTAGYIVDRQSGNTGGLAGPAGVLYVLGEKASTFSYLPVAVALGQMFGRNRKPPSRNARSSPFPESVMFSLAKRIVDTYFGVDEPSLLTTDFQFSGPLVGPLTKDQHLRQSNVAGVKAALPDLELDAYNFEIDAFDPQRVWLILKSSGTQTKALIQDDRVVKEAPDAPAGYESAPEAVSVSINEKGLCYRVTTGYVLDKEVGNTKGLGGSLGLLEAIGAGKFFLETRSIADVARLLKEAVSPPPSTIKAVSAPTPVQAAVVAPPPAPAPKAPSAPPAPKVEPPKVVEKPKAVEKPAPAVEKPVAKPASPAPAPKKVDAPAPSGGMFSFLESSAPAPAPVKPAAKVPEPAKTAASAPVKPAAPAAAAKPSGGLFSFLESSAPAPAPVKPATKTPEPAKTAAPEVAKAPAKLTAPSTTIKASVTTLKGAIAPATASSAIKTVQKKEPVKEAPKAPEVSKAAPVKAVAPAPVKPATPAPAPASAPSGGFFGFLSEAPKTDAPKQEAKAGGFSLFGGSSAPPAKPAAKSPEPAKPSGGLFSFLESSAPAPAPAKPVAKTPEPAKAAPAPVKPAGGFSMFGGSAAPALVKPAVKVPEQVKPAAPAAAAKPSGGLFSFLESSAPAPAPVKPATKVAEATKAVAPAPVKPAAPTPVKPAAPAPALVKPVVKPVVQAVKPTAPAPAVNKEADERAKKAAVEKAQREAASKAKQDALVRAMAKAVSDEKSGKSSDSGAIYMDSRLDGLPSAPASSGPSNSAGPKGPSVKVGRKSSGRV